MFRWVASRLKVFYIKTFTKEIEQYTNMLKGMSDEELGFLLMGSTIMRENIMADGMLPVEALNLDLPRSDEICEVVPVKLNTLIKQFQKMDQPTDAAFTMVWLHSVRALNVLEIRYLGQLMWAELVRGVKYLHIARENIQELRGTEIPLQFEDEARFIPIGLEPRM